nr:hypothetical protein [uncultured Rhodopila sp.]
MATNRLDAPGSKLACAERWLPDVAFLPEAGGLAVDQLYRALDFLAVRSDRVEHEVFLQAADLFRLDVDLIFYDTTTAYFETDEVDEEPEEWGGRLFAPLRRCGDSKEGRDNQPQVIIALAVTRDGMPVRSWVLPAIPPMSPPWRGSRMICAPGAPAGTAPGELAALAAGPTQSRASGRCGVLGVTTRFVRNCTLRAIEIT